MKITKEVSKENVKRIYSFSNNRFSEFKSEKPFLQGKPDKVIYDAFYNKLKTDLGFLTLKNINNKLFVDYGESNSIVPFKSHEHNQLVDVFVKIYYSVIENGLTKTYDFAYIWLNKYIMSIDDDGFNINQLVTTKLLTPTETKIAGANTYRFYVDNTSYKLGIYPISENQLGKKIVLIINNYTNKKYAIKKSQLDSMKFSTDLKNMFNNIQELDEKNIVTDIITNHFYNDRNYKQIIQHYLDRFIKDYND